MEEDIRIGISIGDINGIGPEIIIKAFADNRLNKLYTPVIFGSTKVLSYYKKAIDAKDFNFFNPRDGEIARGKVNVINCWEDHVDITPGQATEEGGKRAFQALEAAVVALKEGSIHALVTAPINKHVMQGDGFSFPGHTEYLAERFEAKDSLMFLVQEEFRVGVVTGHIPLAQVSTAVTEAAIKSKLDAMMRSLKKDFGISKPKIAVLGINPHAGEQGLLGQEEEILIKPLVQSYREKGNLVFGPFPADGFFGTGSWRQYDGVLAMYHDQGLIPFKQLAFENGVNFTAGLSAVRTSPDHGTAYDLAAKGTANEQSFVQAYLLAADIVRNRREYGQS
jgi:4-hydroxythreonine-4-phosphate dehydrogenase